MKSISKRDKILFKVTEGDFIEEDMVKQFKGREHIALLTLFNGGACISRFYGSEEDFDKYRDYFDKPSGISTTDTYLVLRQLLLDADYLPTNKKKMQEFIKQSKNGEIKVVATVFFEFYRPEKNEVFKIVESTFK